MTAWKEKTLSNHFSLFRITGEPLFTNTDNGLLYSDQFGYGNNNEESSSTLEPGAVGFNLRSHVNDLDRFLSATIGHPQILQNVADYNPDESDDMSDEYEDMDEEDASNGDESSPGELDEWFSNVHGCVLASNTFGCFFPLFFLALSIETNTYIRTGL